MKSIEKYLQKKLVLEEDIEFIKLIGDKYFTQRSLPDMINDYKQNYPIGKDKNGKKLYKMICSNLLKNGISSEKFLQYLCEDIYEHENFTQFIRTLSRMLS